MNPDILVVFFHVAIAFLHIVAQLFSDKYSQISQLYL